MIRTAESTRKLARRVRIGTASIGSATVSYGGGRWFVSFVVTVQCHPRAARALARWWAWIWG
ncbi:hypothetical protein AB0N05_00340 [Nocardia sp. NPDC051030]|uniref:hypothetical protein n=1 Tax=Nocardia sp. NPDC051030 TaxID=3155162 RepID=UPI00344A1C28